MGVSVKLRKKLFLYSGLKIKVKQKFNLPAKIYVHFAQIIRIMVYSTKFI